MTYAALTKPHDPPTGTAATDAVPAGSVMGVSVVSLALGGLSVLYLIFRSDAFNDRGYLAGFGMGASSVSLFTRVGT